ncbi:MAG: hypothetical protein JXJ22_17855 [Bacteroidales bacterium]|nr:hypothetical protein [Bacteroidales bacterium]
MSFAGIVFDMINRFKYNESMRKVRKERYTKIRDLYIDSLAKHKIEFIDRKKLPPEAMKKLKEKIRKQMSRTRIRNNIITVIVSLVILSVILFGFYLFREIHF